MPFLPIQVGGHLHRPHLFTVLPASPSPHALPMPTMTDVYTMQPPPPLSPWHLIPASADTCHVHTLFCTPPPASCTLLLGKEGDT